MKVFVFKTSIHLEHVPLINTILRSVIPECFWSYDLEDCDRILKVKSHKNITASVCFHLKMEGFYCEELQ